MIRYMIAALALLATPAFAQQRSVPDLTGERTQLIGPLKQWIASPNPNPSS